MGGVEGFEMDEDDEMSIVGASERNQDRERLPHEELSSDSSKAAAAAGGVPCLEELHEQHRPNEGRGVAPGGEVEEETTTVYGAEESELHGRAAVATFPLASETILEEKAMESNLLATASDDVIIYAEQRPGEQWVEEQEGAVAAGMMQEGMASRCVEVRNEGIASVEVKYGQVSESSTPVPFPSLLGASEEKVGSEILLPVDDAVENVDQKNQEHQLEEEGEGVRGEVMLEAVVSHCAEATEEGIAADGEMNGEAPGPPPTVHFPSFSGASGEDRSPSIALLPADDALDEDERKHLQNFQAEEARGVTTEVMEEGVVKRCAEATEEVLAAMEVRYGQVTESPAPFLFPSVPGESREEKVGSTVLLPVLDIVEGCETQMDLQEDEGVRKELMEGVLSKSLKAPTEGISDHNMEGMQLFESPTTTSFPSSSGVAAGEVPSVYSLHVLDTNKAAVEEVEVRPSTVEAVKNAQVTHTMVEVVKDVEVTPMTAEAVESVPIVAVTKEEEEVTPTKSEGLETETYLTTTRGEAVEAELKPIMVGIVEEVVAAATMTEAVEVEVKPRMLETLGPVVARTTIGEAVEEVKPSSMMTEPSDDLRPIPKIEEALGEKAVPQRMDVAKIKDEQTSQSIIDADVSMEDDMGLVAPMSAVDDGMEDVEQEEMAASMMGVPEDHEAALEDGSRRGGKKRGRPPKAQAGRVPTTKKKEEEDVCFICFDGGNLVVCDRRGCPKVYHPSCVNRDEAFFRSKGRWNCGWHICSICEKAAHYMCFTCTYSLCKSCIKEAQFVCVRGNKGFCETCKSTVMLIETDERERKREAGVNFDDRSSWEYLFKDYWLDLKGKLSITLEEVSRAKNPLKGSSARNDDLLDEPYDAKDDLNSSSDSSSGHHQRSKSAKKKVKKSSKAAYNGEQAVRLPDKENASLPVDSEWASKELLEFVAHMRKGDISVMCQFDVHTLLLEYIKQNNLRDPRRKSQIICDARLENLFGKARVGHFEMLKLLESHFLAKETSLVVTDDNQGSVLDPESSQMDNEGNSNSVLKTGSDKKQKSRKKVGKGEHQSNLDDYAAIDVHNISLVYLRRNLMEELLDDTEFNDKVVGSFVRIRISGAGLRKDMYRLVQVIGTSRAEEKYKTGKKKTDISLEILNLSKTEVVSIDSISNQEFTEEECKRLRQSIKCGLINRLTVGDIQGKAQALQSVRVNESLENEKLRLSHLRDRASEKGHRKELRECVEKLQLLNSPEERSRRLNEVPAVHVDPKMDPNYESDEEEFGYKRPESFLRSRDSLFASKRRESNHSAKGNLTSSDSFSEPHRASSLAWEPNKAATGYAEINGATSNHRKEKGPASWDTSKSLPSAAATDHGFASAGQSVRRPGAAASETSPTSHGGGALTPLPVNDNEKIWHYKDPSGKIQGPFSMTQLRKWNTTGYFPANLRIWRASEKEEDSILLADALLGKFHRDPSYPGVTQLPKVSLATDVGRNEVGSALASQSQAPFLGNSYQLPVQGRGEGGDPSRWHGSPNQGNNTWAFNRATMVQPHSLGYERQNSSGRETNRSLWANDSPRLASVGLSEIGGAALAIPEQAQVAPSAGVAAGRDSQRFAGVANELVAPRVPLKVEMMNAAVGRTSSDCLTPTPKGEQAKFDALNPEPMQQSHLDGDSKRRSFELHQRYNISVAPNEVLPEPGIQSRHQNPGQSHTSTSEQRSEWSMPSPTPAVEPSRFDAVAGQSAGSKKMEHGVPQETMGAAGGSGIVGGAAVPVAGAQGPGGAAWGALMQGNTGGVWVAPSQANPATSIGWGPPALAQANPNANLLWVAQAQAYPGWGAPVQGVAPNPNLNSAGWLPAAPPNVQPIPNWGGVAAQQGASNPTQQTWVLPQTDGGTAGGGSQSLQSNQPGPDSGQQGWARAAPPGGGGDPSWGAPRGQDAGICKFYERGHCKKGDACNYMHFR